MKLTNRIDGSQQWSPAVVESFDETSNLFLIKVSFFPVPRRHRTRFNNTLTSGKKVEITSGYLALPCGVITGEKRTGARGRKPLTSELLQNRSFAKGDVFN